MSKPSVIVILLLTFYLDISNAGDYGIFLFCENDTKHCIDCAQIGFSHGEYFQVPNYYEYTDQLISAINNKRSEYAHDHNIGNMRIAVWNYNLFWFIRSMTSDVGNAKFNCVTGNKSVRYPTQFNHEIVDFNTSFRIKMNKNSTNPIVFRMQYNELVKKALRWELLTEYNVDEFACEYSFKPLKRQTHFLLRCIFYINPEYSEGIIKSSNLCSKCSSRESCTTQSYPGLCRKISY